MNKEVVEVCPHCAGKVTMEWDVEASGYRAFCPHCGKQLMLCTECLRRDGGSCDYDKRSDICKMNGGFVVSVYRTFCTDIIIQTGSDVEAVRIAEELFQEGVIGLAVDDEVTEHEVTAIRKATAGDFQIMQTFNDTE